MSTKCPQCGTENQDNAKFCNECGYKFPQQNVCPSCGLPVQPGIKFCSNCGHSFVAKTVPQPVHTAVPRQQSSAPQAAPVTPHQPTPTAPAQQQPPTPQSASTVHAQPQSPTSQPTRAAHTQQQSPVPRPTPETDTPSSPAPQEQPTAPKPVSPRSHKRIFGRMGKKEEDSKPAADGTTEFVDPDQFFNQQSPVRNTPTPPSPAQNQSQFVPQQPQFNQQPTAQSEPMQRPQQTPPQQTYMPPQQVPPEREQVPPQYTQQPIPSNPNQGMPNAQQFAGQPNAMGQGPWQQQPPVGQAPNPQGYFYEQQMSPQQSQFQQEQQSSPMQEQQTQPRANERLNPLAYLSKNKPQDDEEIQPAAEEATAETEEESAPRKKKKREKNKKKKDKESAEMREQKRRKQFQSRANTDGYYTDRDTMDELEEFDGERRIQWIPMIVGFAGIIIFAVILIQLQSIIM